VKSLDWPGPFLPPVSDVGGGGTSGIRSPGLGSSFGPQPTRNKVRNKIEHERIVVQVIFACFFIMEQFWKKSV
jgi:hypothetical protein